MLLSISSTNARIVEKHGIEEEVASKTKLSQLSTVKRAMKAIPSLPQKDKEKT